MHLHSQGTDFNHVVMLEFRWFINGFVVDFGPQHTGDELQIIITAVLFDSGGRLPR